MGSSPSALALLNRHRASQLCRAVPASGVSRISARGVLKVRPHTKSGGGGGGGGGVLQLRSDIRKVGGGGGGGALQVRYTKSGGGGGGGGGRQDISYQLYFTRIVLCDDCYS